MSARAKMMLAGLAGGAVLLGGLEARLAAAEEAAPSAPGAITPDSNSNPYSVIIDRNVFRLNPPPAPKAADPGPPPDLPKVHLSGFIQTGDQWKVLLAVETKAENAATPASISYSTMAEGDKDGAVELLKMYPGEEKVDINNSGTPMTLTMKDNGFSQTAPAVPAGARGGPAIRPLGAPAATPPPSIPGLGAAPMPDGQNPGGGGALVGGSRFSSGGFNNPAVFGGGMGINTGIQPQQAMYQPGSSGVISAGGRAYTPPAAPLTIPLGQNGLNHLSQPNSTPVSNPGNANTEMPPLPPIP